MLLVGSAAAEPFTIASSEVVRDRRSLDPLREAWDALALLAENPFAGPDWLEAWLEHEREEEPFVVVHRDNGGQVVGVVSLVLRRRGPLRVIAPPGGDAVDWCGPAARPADHGQIARATAELLGAIPGWDMCVLERCLEGSSWLVGLQQAAAAAGTRLTQYRAENSLCEVPLAAGAALVSGKQRRELARQRRRLEERHEVGMRCSSGGEEAEADFAAFQRLHAVAFGEADARVNGFHRSFALRMAARGRLRLWTLDVDAQTAAVLYGWRVGQRTFAYMQAFDRSLEPFAAGIRLLAQALEDSFAEGVECFDMLRGEERHKRRFAVELRPVETWVLTRRRGRGAVATVALVALRRTWKRLPPRLRRAVRPA